MRKLLAIILDQDTPRLD